LLIQVGGALAIGNFFVPFVFIFQGKSWERVGLADCNSNNIVLVDLSHGGWSRVDFVVRAWMYRLAFVMH
jgi:hypothetical protein